MIIRSYRNHQYNCCWGWDWNPSIGFGSKWFSLCPHTQTHGPMGTQSHCPPMGTAPFPELAEELVTLFHPVPVSWRGSQETFCESTCALSETPRSSRQRRPHSSLLIGHGSESWMSSHLHRVWGGPWNLAFNLSWSEYNQLMTGACIDRQELISPFGSYDKSSSRKSSELSEEGEAESEETTGGSWRSENEVLAGVCFQKHMTGMCFTAAPTVHSPEIRPGLTT